MKKITVILACMLVCFLLFTGCTTQKDSTDQDTNLGHLPMIFDAKWQNFCVRKIPMPMPVQAQGS